MGTEIEKIKQVVHRVDGWLPDSEGELLYRLAKNCTGKGVIVEIGSWKGKSTIWLGIGSQAGKRVKVYAIDPHNSAGGSAQDKIYTFDEFRRNIDDAGISGIVTPLVTTSEEAARTFQEPVELIFVDGAHDYEAVKRDFALWFPKVIDGGYMAFHDTILWDGPRKSVEEDIYRSTRFKDVIFVNSITAGRKVARNTGLDRVRSRLVLLLKNLYEFFLIYIMPRPIRRFGKRVLALARKPAG